ncbi:MAG: MiaB/RimO family radical SAM methylthiotransferase [Deltaproteobacteria bacterium]|jgi:MiaB/RimO family radical SAM methylthiotransferase|nr:MiaB/RimO family radical SAM methylthiotransferase [Deltaproteobacteria bacterium]
MADWIFFLATFGCKVNQYESQALREAWHTLGGREADDPADAAGIVINTCAVTARAASDARQAVRSLHRQAPDARIVLTGCSASLAGPQLAALPGVAAVIAQSDKERLLAGPPFACSSPDVLSPTAPSVPNPDWPALRIASYRRSRPVLKVQDGCSHGCAYCVVPLTRGPARSRAPEDVLAEAKRLLAAGYRELVLSGVNLLQYRMPGTDRLDFWDLLARLDAALTPQWQGRARLRLSSIDPAQLGPKARDTLAAAHLVCPHVHISLQSGSPAVLRRMGRSHYDPGAIPDALRDLSAIWPVFGLGADVLVGFPGESRAECRETLDLLHALPLSYAHVFPYSRRPGTAAADLPDLPGPEKRARAALARTVAAAKQRNFLQSLLNVPELRLAPDAPQGNPGEDEDEIFLPVNAQDSGRVRGVTECYAACLLPAGSVKAGSRELLRVRPTGLAGARLTAVPA